MTQKDRILKMLHQRGSLGVTPVDFASPNVIDGGEPIMRVAGRINDLRNDGYEIRTFKKGPVALYVLMEGFALTTPSEVPERVVGASGMAGAEWSTESPVVTAPGSWRPPESSPEDYIEDGELQWV